MWLSGSIKLTFFLYFSLFFSFFFHWPFYVSPFALNQLLGRTQVMIIDVVFLASCPVMCVAFGLYQHVALRPFVSSLCLSGGMRHGLMPSAAAWAFHAAWAALSCDVLMPLRQQQSVVMWQCVEVCHILPRISLWPSLMALPFALPSCPVWTACCLFPCTPFPLVSSNSILPKHIYTSSLISTGIRHPPSFSVIQHLGRLHACFYLYSKAILILAFAASFSFLLGLSSSFLLWLLRRPCSCMPSQCVFVVWYSNECSCAWPLVCVFSILSLCSLSAFVPGMPHACMAWPGDRPGEAFQCPSHQASASCSFVSLFCISFALCLQLLIKHLVPVHLTPPMSGEWHVWHGDVSSLLSHVSLISKLTASHLTYSFISSTSPPGTSFISINHYHQTPPSSLGCTLPCALSFLLCSNILPSINVLINKWNGVSPLSSFPLLNLAVAFAFPLAHAVALTTLLHVISSHMCGP